MPRVLVVSTSFPAHADDPSGHFVETEARLRVRAGDDVVVLTPRPSGIVVPRADGLHVEWLDGGDAFGWPGVLTRLRESPVRALGAAQFVLAARRAAERLGPFDDVIAHWLVPAAWPIAPPARRVFEVVVHGSDVGLVERLPRAYRVALARRLLARGARFRFVSRDLMGRFVAATTTDVVANSYVEPCAIDVLGAPSRAAARLLHGLGDERLAVVVGRLVPSKAPARAVSLALEATDHVVVVGDGPLLDELVAAFPGVRFVGKLSRRDALAWIAAADVVVSASREEGASTVVREARALGTRVLAVPAGDLAAQALLDPGITLVTDAVRETAARS
ncbi:MAG TPA: glycosyltransferase family 4 protein [Polyangiaceae bacterium]|nr:glycosyltransferase family 4 protein [Polyangiaceae bacterium]